MLRSELKALLEDAVAIAPQAATLAPTPVL